MCDVFQDVSLQAPSGGFEPPDKRRSFRRLLNSRSAVLAANLLLLGVAPLDAQIPALQKKADSLLAEWRQAKAFADLQDSLRAAGERGGRDTIRVGALVYLVNRSPLPLAQAAAIAWPQIERFYGPAAQAFAQHP